MNEKKKTLRTVRTITFSYDTVWPDHYGDDTLAEAVKAELELDRNQVVEIIGESAKLTVNVEVLP